MNEFFKIAKKDGFEFTSMAMPISSNPEFKGIMQVGWIGFHRDNVKARKTTIEVLYADDNGIFVHTVDRKLVGVKLKDGEKICFNHRAYHAFLPKEIALECVRNNSKKHQGLKFSDFAIDTKPRVIFRDVVKDEL